MRRGRGWLSLLVAGLAGCGQPAAVQPPDLEPGWTRIETPALDLPPGQEVFLCYFGTFEADYGIRGARHWTDSPMLHAEHILARSVPSDNESPDDAVRDCEETGDWWYGGAPLYESPGRGFERGEGLPPGVAFAVGAGQRFAIDSHFINTTDTPSTATVIVDLLLVPGEDVELPAGAFSFDLGGELDVPPGGRYTESFECQWHTDVTILDVGSHMHERGAAFALDWIDGDGTVTRVIDEPEWSDGYDDAAAPDLEPRYVQGSVAVRRGDTFRTTCTWENPSDHALVFPEEMCTTYGSAYPLPHGANCSAGGWSTPRPEDGPSTGGWGQLRGTLSVPGADPTTPGDILVSVLDPTTGEPAAPSFSLPGVVTADYPEGIPYAVEDIPLRIAAYEVMAVFDADRSGTASGPGAGDFVARGPDGAPIELRFGPADAVMPLVLRDRL